MMTMGARIPSTADSRSDRSFLQKRTSSLFRFYLWIYVPTFLLLLLAYIPTVGHALVVLPLPLQLVLGLMGSVTAVVFLVLFGVCIYHYFRGPNSSHYPSVWWLWGLLFLSMSWCRSTSCS